MRDPISVQVRPAPPAVLRIRSTLYCDGDNPASIATAFDRVAATAAAWTRAISTSSSRLSAIPIAAAGLIESIIFLARTIVKEVNYPLLNHANPAVALWPSCVMSTLKCDARRGSGWGVGAQGT
jgi:hypothetical protein